MKLPVGLAEMWQALAPDGKALDHAITLVFLRQLLDPGAPMIAGHDPRALVLDPITWQDLDDEQLPQALDILVARVNELVGDEYLTGGFAALTPHSVKRAYEGVSRWDGFSSATGGDMLGELLERLRGGGPRNDRFYTPYHVSYMMALMSGVTPGQSVCDPACGSGRMLLAALQVCRTQHGGEPELFGMDSDAEAVRVCRLNMLLAGYRHHRQAVEEPAFAEHGGGAPKQHQLGDEHTKAA